MKIDIAVREVCRESNSKTKGGKGNALNVSSVLFGAVLAISAFGAEVEKIAETCFACHGMNGVSAENMVPTIAGYSAEYFGFSLNLYRQRERPCVEVEYPRGSKKGIKTSMCEIVKDLRESDIEQIGEYFENQKFVRTVQAFDTELAKKGELIHRDKCEVCHTKSGNSPADNIGILAGQKMAYLREQIKFVKEGKRFTSKKMKMRLDALSDEDMEAVVHYYGSLQ